MHWLGYDLWNRGAALAGGKRAVTDTDSACEHTYNSHVEAMRETEFPMLGDSIYLDHAGTTLYSKSLVDQVSADLMKNLLGNPHSGSSSSQLSTAAVEDVRLAVLDFFNADPNDFDVVFVANATAGVKLVVESIADYRHKDLDGQESRGFWYGYHQDSHTSLVGVRETAKLGSKCFRSDQTVEKWISRSASREKINLDTEGLKLFSYPAQSNMSGRRLPLNWAGAIRRACPNTYTLLDAAAYASTGILDLRDADNAPDFTVLSFYKIFGYPDLGALIVRRNSAHILIQRPYFGGGTVDMVLCLKEKWHTMKEGIHERLEDGTLPFHSIMALGAALSVHKKLFTSQDKVSRHVTCLVQRLHAGLSSLKHDNSRPVCRMYTGSKFFTSKTQGPIVSFNLLSSSGSYIPLAELQKLCNIRNIHLRTGSVCNPGGVASALGLASWEMRRNFSAGAKCEAADDLVFGKPTGIARISVGAMSTLSDVDRFVDFIREFYVDHDITNTSSEALFTHSEPAKAEFSVAKLTIYPIKSCAGWDIPESQTWDFHPAGLAFDREWCLVHRGTNNALSMKKYPLMALIKPSINLKGGYMKVTVADKLLPSYSADQETTITIHLSSLDPSLSKKTSPRRPATVCSDEVPLQTYDSDTYSRFFSTALGVDCTLARFPAHSSSRHSKPDLFSSSKPNKAETKHPLALSNESPCLIITTPSLSKLPAEVHPSAFRANMILSPTSPDTTPASSLLEPYKEDSLTTLHLPTLQISILGKCRRCQMVCVDPTTGERKEEPFITLWRTRKENGKVWFGVHSGLVMTEDSHEGGGVVKVGDRGWAE